jgi:imidazolonepropionase-like amidohydrolase
MLNFLARPDTDTRTLERFYLPAEQAGALDTGSAEVRAFIQLLKSRGVRVDPTLAGFDFLKQRHGEMAEPFATIASHMPPAIARSFRVGAMTIPDEQTARRYRDSYAAMVAFVGQLYREGIPLVAGTDTFAGFGLHSELALYVKAGLTPAQALQVATWNGARYSGTLADRGSIEVGKFADLVLVAGDPTVDIEAIRQVAVVITRGRLIYPGDILQSIGVKPFVEQAPLVRASSPRKLARLSPPG